MKRRVIASALTSASIQSSDIHTTWYSIHPNYGQPDKNGQPSMNGFQAVNNIQVTVRNLNNVGNIVDLLVKSGANQVNNVQYQVSNPLQIENKGYDSALLDARSQADSIAKSLGVSIGSVQSVDTTANQGPVGPIMAESSATAANGTVLSPGSQDLSTNVKVVYTINNSSGQ